MIFAWLRQRAPLLLLEAITASMGVTSMRQSRPLPRCFFGPSKNDGDRRGQWRATGLCSIMMDNS